MDHLFNPAEAVSSEPVVAAETESSISQVQPEEDLPPLPAVPDVSLPVFDYCDSISYFCYSLQGSSHKKSGMPCQDRCYSKYVKSGGYLITAIADGVGSCVLSDLGAHVAVHTSVDFLADQLSKLPKKDFTVAQIGQLLRKTMQTTYDAVEKTAEDAQQLLFSLQSTLTVAVYDGNDLYFAHAGDDGIVALNTDGCLQLATVRHKGEEASSVYPLQSVGTWQYGMFKNTAAFVMATDGVLDSFVSTAYENNRIYYPFIQRAFSAKITSAMETRAICHEMYAHMQEAEFRRVVTDDLTIAVVTNQKRVHTCLPDFDQDQWDAQTQRYQEARYQALYGKNQDSNSPGDASAVDEPEHPNPVWDAEAASDQAAEPQHNSQDPVTDETPTQHDSKAAEASVPLSPESPNPQMGNRKRCLFFSPKKHTNQPKNRSGHKARNQPRKNSTLSGEETNNVLQKDWRDNLAEVLIYMIQICTKALLVLVIFTVFCLFYFFVIHPLVLRNILSAFKILSTLF